MPDLEFNMVIQLLSDEYDENYSKLKWLRDSGRVNESVEELSSYCDQLEKAIDFLEDTPSKLESLESEVKKLKHFEDVIQTIASVTKNMNL